MTLPLINYDEVVNAFDPSDEGYSACTVAASFVAGCVAELGGSEALSTANPLKFAACVCCVGTTDVAPVYSTCSDYLSSGAPDLDSQISGVYLPICNSCWINTAMPQKSILLPLSTWRTLHV
jgi:hypothetical protein